MKAALITLKRLEGACMIVLRWYLWAYVGLREQEITVQAFSMAVISLVRDRIVAKRGRQRHDSFHVKLLALWLTLSLGP